MANHALIARVFADCKKQRKKPGFTIDKEEKKEKKYNMADMGFISRSEAKKVRLIDYDA